MSMDFWNRFDRPPISALKSISAGRLKGKNDINPQWRYQALTEVFGVCGFGWKFTVDRLWTEVAHADQVMCFANVSLFVKIDGQWSEAIPGNGGSMLITKETAGLHSSDEGYKMAITDAVGTAAKMLGVAAEIYLGNFDGSKYKTDRKEIASEDLLDSQYVKDLAQAVDFPTLLAVWNKIPQDERPKYNGIAGRRKAELRPEGEK